jgi:hypothetical protein
MWCRIEGTPPFADIPTPAAANCADMGLNTGSSVVISANLVASYNTDLMLPNGMKNQSVTILGKLLYLKIYAGWALSLLHA